MGQTFSYTSEPVVANVTNSIALVESANSVDAAVADAAEVLIATTTALSSSVGLLTGFYSILGRIYSTVCLVFSTSFLYIVFAILVYLLYKTAIADSSSYDKSSFDDNATSPALNDSKAKKVKRELSSTSTALTASGNNAKLTIPSLKVAGGAYSTLDKEDVLFDIKLKHILYPLENLGDPIVQLWIEEQKDYYDAHFIRDIVPVVGGGADSLDTKSPTSASSSSLAAATTSTTTTSLGTSNINKNKDVPSVLPQQQQQPSTTSAAKSNKTSKDDPVAVETDSKSARLLSGSGQQGMDKDNLDKYNYNMIKVCKAVNNMSSFKIVYPPIQKGRHFFYYKQDHYFMPQPTLYYTRDIKKDGKVVLDVTNLFPIGYVLRGSWVSHDGIKVAYGISTAHSDLGMSLYVRDVVSGVDSNIDIIRDCSATQFSLSWTEDHLGFYYSIKDVVMYHKLGTASSSHDIMMFSNERIQMQITSVTTKNKSASSSGDTKASNETSSSSKDSSIVPPAVVKFQCFNPIVTHDSRFLVVEAFHNAQFIDRSSSSSSSNGEEDKLDEATSCLHQSALNDELGCPANANALFFIEIPRSSSYQGKESPSYAGTIIAALSDTRYLFQYITNDGSKFVFRTNYMSNGFRVMDIDIQSSTKTVDYTSTDLLNSRPTISNDKDGSKKEKKEKKEIATTASSVRELVVEDFVERVRERADGGVLLRSFVVFESILVLHYLINAANELLLYDYVSEPTTVTEDQQETSPNATSASSSSSSSSATTTSDKFTPFKTTGNGGGGESNVTDGGNALSAFASGVDSFFTGMVDTLKEIGGGDATSLNSATSLKSAVVQPRGQEETEDNNLLKIVVSLPLPLGVSVTAAHGSSRSKFVFYQYQGLGEIGSVYRVSLFRNKSVGSAKASLELTLDHLCKSSIPGFNNNLYETRVERIAVRARDTASATPVKKAETGSIDESSDCTKDSRSLSISNQHIEKLPITIFGAKSNLPSTSISTSDDPATNGNSSPTPIASTTGSSKPSPCIILLHGGFGVSLLPTMSLPLLSFVKDYGGIVCMVHVRGGGELGRAWHAAAAGSKRAGSVDDLLTAVEFLIKSGYTTPSKLSIIGGSVGGLVAAAAANQYPELFSSIVLEDSILDVMRHQIYDIPSTAGPDFDGLTNVKPTMWTDELGCSIDSKEECARLLKLCPIQNMEKAFVKMVTIKARIGEGSSSLLSYNISNNNAGDNDFNISDNDLPSSSSSLSKDEIAARCREGGASSSSFSFSSSISSTPGSADSSSRGGRRVVTAASRMSSNNNEVPAILVCTGQGSMVSPIHSFKYVAHWQSLLTKYKVDSKPCLLRYEGFLQNIDSSPFSSDILGQQMLIGDSIPRTAADNYKIGIYEARKMAEIVAFIISNMSIPSSIDR